ncbi:MAG: hypothetical protein KAH57_02625, partial [Thermoplasmata archaeon]|nr:hypothetical protein [Thermoplasmata archaeon]
MKGDKLRSLSIILILITTSLLIMISSPEDLSRIHLVGSSGASFADGNGTVGNPYQISNVSQLQNMSEDLEAHYLLINDIDASVTVNWNSGKGFLPVAPDK